MLISGEKYQVGNKHAREHGYTTIVGEVVRLARGTHPSSALTLITYRVKNGRVVSANIHREDLLPIAVTNEGSRAYLSKTF